MKSVSKKYQSLFLIAFISLPLSFSSCKKEKQGVPNVAVDVRMYSGDPNFVTLNSVGGWAYVNGGNRGLLIYRKSISDFMAFDRTCTYNPSDPNETIVVETNNNIIATDPHCGSKFLMTDGSINQGPATLPLKAYQTTFDGNMLHIFN